MPLSEAAQHRVAQEMDALLARSGVSGTVPTPLDVVGRSAGIKSVLAVGDLPESGLAKKPPLLRRLVGALMYREELAFVDRSTSLGRGRFIEAHEIVHGALGWHRDSHEIVFDDDGCIDRATEEELEAEANFGAARLLFQGTRFNEVALDYQVSLRVPLLLAGRWETSLHAAIWQYVEYHPDRVALIVTGTRLRANRTVPIWNTVESPAFRQRFGRFGDWFPKPELRMEAATEVPSFGQLANRAMLGEELPTDEVPLLVDGAPFPFIAEAFFNQRTVFVMVRPRGPKVALGRRIRLATA